jgi:hypothetical protein
MAETAVDDGSATGEVVECDRLAAGKYGGDGDTGGEQRVDQLVAVTSGDRSSKKRAQ